ncbi:hypothetical protein LY01_00480 [Nonlabens xylanidelens]|uniref:Uncharacterized protein n=1 Tax=Nonlabens xylanidelens TaxID=191564 RepID=A0A2S6IQY9_9FLAO|nr:hypothetical protein [Nonlabens xylanidelens]PPK96657.1 hypothetical protein LY01_00480 [Nonlabens xylanidelens]PQJ13373.1 hypothetical protein BST94_13485 [Nonlabens xylanidelens]
MINRYVIVLIGAFFCNTLLSQSIPKDYIFTNNDTIYGFVIGDQLKVYDNITKQFDYYNLRKVDSFVRNKQKFKKFEKEYYDGIYEDKETDSLFIEEYFINHIKKEKRLPDYIVKESNDTIYSIIYKNIFGKPYYIEDSKLTKISPKQIKSYRFKNKIFQRLNQLKKKGAFYEEIIVGSLSLYGITKKGHHVLPIGVVGMMPIIPYKEVDYYVFENGKLNRIHKLTRGVCNRLFRENPMIWNEMKRNKLNKNNLPLIVEYYNLLQTQ